MKRTQSIIIVFVLLLSLCFSGGAFAEELYPDEYISYYLEQQGLSPASVELITDISDLHNCYSVTFSDGSIRYYDYSVESGVGATVSERTNPYGTGSLISEVSDTEDKQSVINYVASGIDSYSVVLPTQYSTNTTASGSASKAKKAKSRTAPSVYLSGDFKIHVDDIQGDGLHWVSLQLVSAQNTEEYFIDSDDISNTRYPEQNADGTLIPCEEYYLENEYNSDAKIQYSINNPESQSSSIFSVGDYVILNSMDTVSADFGPTDFTGTLHFYLNPYGNTPITDIPHGTYSDVLTFQSAISAKNPLDSEAEMSD